MKIDTTQLEGLIWDMDGVLVDESKSYLEAIRVTAGKELNREVTEQEVDEVKKLVGMNNDWYATFSIVTGEKDYTKINPESELFKKLARMFDAVYLGSKLYELNYKEKAPLEQEEGLITLETAFLTDENLAALKQKYGKMGIATGRPRFDANFVIERFNWSRYFDVVVTAYDTENEKPAPDPILKAVELLNISKTIYIGDNISDVVASAAANIPIIFIGSSKDITNFSNALAVKDQKELIDILL